MNKAQIRQLNRLKAREAFLTVHEADFPPDSSGGRTLALLRAAIARIEGLAARKVSGKISQNVAIKRKEFAKLEGQMRLIGKASRSLADEIPGIEELYRVSDGNQSEEAILAKARQFYIQSADHRTEMVDAGLDDDFRDQLNNQIAVAAALIENTDAAQSDRGGAVGALEAEFREANRLGRKLDNLVKIKYAADPDILDQWKIASKLRAADSDEEKETPPPEGGTP